MSQSEDTQHLSQCHKAGQFICNTIQYTFSVCSKVENIPFIIFYATINSKSSDTTAQVTNPLWPTEMIKMILTFYIFLDM